MNAVVEVESAVAAARVVRVVAQAFSAGVWPLIIALSGRASTSTLHIISQGSHSISAVAPDHFTLGGPAVVVA